MHQVHPCSHLISKKTCSDAGWWPCLTLLCQLNDQNYSLFLHGELPMGPPGPVFTHLTDEYETPKKLHIIQSKPSISPTMNSFKFGDEYSGSKNCPHVWTLFTKHNIL